MQPLGWRMDVADWEPPGTDELVRRLEAGVTPGAVVLLHEGGGDRSQTVAAVDHVIPRWKSEGWTFTLPAGSGDPDDPGDPAGSCDVTCSVVNDWGGGMQGSITVSNTGPSAISDWTLRFSLSGVSVTNGWNGTWSQNGSQTTVSAPSWNSAIQPGQSIQLGFVADRSGSIPPPSRFTLNGAACS